jgi:predicted urease superfamily metal-dependent hydrolase
MKVKELIKLLLDQHLDVDVEVWFASKRITQKVEEVAYDNDREVVLIG